MNEMSKISVSYESGKNEKGYRYLKITWNCTNNTKGIEFFYFSHCEVKTIFLGKQLSGEYVFEDGKDDDVLDNLEVYGIRPV